MLLSIIIVSYEVKYFLEQCLFSVTAAISEVETHFANGQVEVIVVDNASSDGTVDYLRKTFTSVNFIPNKTNVGFARANNLAIDKASGKYLLFLNPDTILPETSLVHCLSFLEDHVAVGAVGVRMVDGSGHFLPESKRGFPTAWRSFCKLSGLSSIFPASRFFAGYNQGHLKPDEFMPVEVLAGAFMMVRKETLDRVGGFDERFFMYAEDIDLSKRLKDAGLDNYYLGNCCIIHFKGESTKKDRVYVKRFYEAMSLYVNKHYTGFGSTISVGVMKAAIGFRAMLASIEVKEKAAANDKRESVRFMGDQATIQFLRNQWSSVKEDDLAEMVVLCQGKDFPFSALIDTIQKLPKASKPMVYASGSNSVVGSFDKNRRGVTEILTSA